MIADRKRLADIILASLPISHCHSSEIEMPGLSKLGLDDLLRQIFCQQPTVFVLFPTLRLVERNWICFSVAILQNEIAPKMLLIPKRKVNEK